ncbi:MAG: FTR1 family protein [Actinomycetota bacterium]|nr:FTR1 family protein [Actinomycetota bacterium]
MGAAVVTLREGFEASLIVGIVLAFLNRTGRRDAFWPVWIGALAAVVISIAAGVALYLIGAEFEGRAEALWEGAIMLTAASMLTWMVFWMRSQARTIRKTLESQVEEALRMGSTFGLAAVAFVGILREGLETALFLLGTFENTNTALSFLSGALGLVAAAVLGYLFYRGSAKLDLRRFFIVTSFILLAFASWLIFGGVHELAEAGVLPESMLLQVGVVVAFAVPAVWFYLRGNSPKPAQKTA